MTGWRIPLEEIIAEDERTPHGAWAWTVGACFDDDRCDKCKQYVCSCWAVITGELV